jgi:serine/threonine protein phosphatase PrpC
MATPSTSSRTAVPGPIFAGEDMAVPTRVPLPGGEAWVFSRRRPGASDNQDAAGCFLLETGGVLVVADGMGGQAGGASASRTAVACLQEQLESLSDAGSVRSAILDAAEDANRRILEAGIGSGTTLAVAEIFVDTLRPYHVGDSEIHVVGQRGRIRLQTVSHTPVAYAVEAGMLDGEEAIHHDQRHIVSNHVGSADMRIEVGSPLVLNRYDTVLLGTDGVFDNLHMSEVVETIRCGSLERAAVELASAASARMDAPVAGKPSKPDDLTFVLYRRSAGA